MMFDSTWMNVLAWIAAFIIAFMIMIQLGTHGSQRDDFCRGGKYNKGPWK